MITETVSIFFLLLRMSVIALDINNFEKYNYFYPETFK